jgi:hypothetical protein
MRKARFHVSTKLTFRGATSIGESWEDKFRPLANLSFHIEYRPVPFGAMIRNLVVCVKEIGITVDNAILEQTLFHAPQLVWRFRRTYYSRRRLRSVSERVAETCHVSKREAVSEDIPLLKVMYKEDSEMAQDLSDWLSS